MLAGQETVSPAKEEANIDGVNRVVSSSSGQIHTLRHQSLDQISQS